jgi:NitT/TauT family transport system ATP-binding protein
MTPTQLDSKNPGSALAISGLSKVFNAGNPNEVTALSDVHLDVHTGEFISLIGPSGCGKSTLLRVIGDLTAFDSGSVQVSGKSPEDARKERLYGIAFQQAALFDWRTVTTNIELPLELAGWQKSQRQERSAELLDMVQLSEFAHHRPWELSGGMQQRVAIARSLAVDPPLLLMDEPFGALDEMTRERMQNELLKIRMETGKTIVFVTHSIPEAVYLSDRVVVMSPRPGRITAEIEVNLGDRDEMTRESDHFFRCVTSVREALRVHDTSNSTSSSHRGEI